MATRSLTVRSKLALVFFSACALTLGVGGTFISRSVSNTLEDEILTRIEFQSRAYATALDGHLSMLSRRTEDFASDGFVRDQGEAILDAGLAESKQLEDLRSSLREHLLRNKLPLVPAFLDLQLVSMRGDLLLAAHRPPPKSILDWLAHKAESNALLVSDLVAAETSDGIARLAVAAPLVSRRSERRLGWLVAWVNPSAWLFAALGQALVEPAADGQPSESIHLVDRTGSRLSLRRELFREGLPALDSEHARSGFGLTLETAARGNERAGEAPQRDGLLLRRFPLVCSGWQLEVESSRELALAAVAGLQGRIIGIGLLVAAAACVLFLLPMGILTRPLLQLAEAARRVGAGEKLPELTPDSNDEIGEVGRSFVAMANAIEERTRLQERTALDLRERQAELQSERDRLKTVIGSMRGGLIVLDPDGHPVVFNQAAEPVLRALHNHEHGISAHHICERITSQNDHCQACLFDPLRAPKSCQVEIGTRTFEIHASQLPPDRDGRLGRVLVCHDFTDRVNQDERMIHQERLAVLGEVAAVMAHELNNPLAAISMYNQMLASELKQEPLLLENVEVIQRNVESCKRAIRELLDYATGATPEVDTIDIGAVLEDVAAFTRPLRERAGVELVVKAPAAPALAWGDELQVRQIFVNLLMNAIQALTPGGGRVNIETTCEDNHVIVIVADNGPGISPEAQAEIFRPFFTTKGRGHGTGLGLPTARRIAEMHGGGVELLQTGEQGSVFRVRLMQLEASLA